jgi:hypothetical protein
VVSFSSSLSSLFGKMTKHLFTVIALKVCQLIYEVLPKSSGNLPIKTIAYHNS